MGRLSVMRRAALTAAAIAVFGVVAPASAAAAEQQYDYRVQMSPYGTIGTYRNTFKTDGKETTMTTEAHIKVSLVGVVLYRLDITRIERRIGDQLVYFHGVTDEGGKKTEVDGRAEGKRFIITSANGSVAAPGTIQPSDPWSAGTAGRDLVFMPDTGAIVRVTTSGGEQTSITLNGASIPVRRYRIATADGSEKYEVWMDEHRVPVKFNIVDREGATTFTLVR